MLLPTMSDSMAYNKGHSDSAAAQRLQLSARAFHRVLKLASAIGDLAGADTIAAPHLAEALQYRPRVDVG